MKNQKIAKQMMPRRLYLAGFTLIELMITVVIASILMSIAIPAYNSQIRKSHRTEAKNALLDLAGREERFFNTNNAYTNVAASLGYAAAGSATTVTNMRVGGGYFTVTATPVAAAPPTPALYTIVATAVGDQAKDVCTSFTVNSNGLQTAAGSTSNPNVDCWK
jgi:type IV pilus assembly protein PilE